jgi:hypothetical protein
VGLANAAQAARRDWPILPAEGGVKAILWMVLALGAGLASCIACLNDDYAKATYYLLAYWIFYRFGAEKGA